MKLESVVFVGDLHGTDTFLKDVLEKYGGQRHLVFLGDYVNRGPHSKEVIETLISAQENWPDAITLLRGNHDQALLDFLNGGEFSEFASLGGLATIASYLSHSQTDVQSSFRNYFPSNHRIFLERLEDYFERGDVFASHCGPNPANYESRKRVDVAIGAHPSLFIRDDLEKLGKHIVCGHYVQRGGKAHMSGRLSAIDTGYGTVAGAPLSVLLWPERKICQFGEV